MDVDQLLTESGARWREATPPPRAYDVEALVFDGVPSIQRGWRLTVTAAVAAAAAVVALVALVGHLLAAPALPQPGSSPSPSSPVVRSSQLVGTWYATVSPTMARAAHRDLVGDWTLSLDEDGTARLSHIHTADALRGHWRLSAATLTVSIPVTGCTTGEGSYEPTMSTLHPGLLTLVPIPGAEACTARALVLGGHWQPGPGAR